ncbi:MAG: hypothetical protein Kow00103_08980 [Candidatus Caldatribacteriota bacterium]
MRKQAILKSAIFFLIIALVITSLAVVVFAKNGGNGKGKAGGGLQQGNLNQNQEVVQIQNQCQENVKMQKQLQECENECSQNCESNCNGECSGECVNEATQLNFNAGALKNMTITKIADLWGVDADTLLAKIVETFNLTGTYSTTNTLNDLRAEYRFAPYQVREIIENLM